MSALPYHKRYHSDALAGFMPLTLEERGAYQTILDMIYDRGGPLIDNERLLAGYMNCSIRKWRQIRDQLIQKGKIAINKDGMIYNSRARKEIENASKTQRKLIESGAKGGRVRAENEKKPNENSETDQASLEPALSDPQAIRALPDTRSYKRRNLSVSPRATKIPDDWKPEPFGEGSEAAGIIAGWDRPRLDRQVERFRDYHRAKGGKFSDWQAAWGNWVRNSVEFDRSRNGGSTTRDFEDIVIEEAQRRRAAAVGS